MPDRTFISKNETAMPGFKVFKEGLKLLLVENAAEYFKLKPFLIYTSKNPRALKGIDKTRLPIVWRSNKKKVGCQKAFFKIGSISTFVLK